MSDEEIFGETPEEIAAREFMRAHPSWWGRSPTPPSTSGLHPQEARYALMTNAELLAEEEDAEGVVGECEV